ncbi:RNA polymerase sigma factor [Neobacillus soli]|uniref:RNA polymerase sigma factor n=1 Tax=Neobacillus soli TaxID=220688 RepID=UPI000B1C84D4|nr:RNA polymerase sigma factor [Neobacillus soli]
MRKDKEELLMEWYEQYYDDIYRFILFMIGDKQSCEDLVHDTFLRAFTGLEQFENRSTVKTWLFGIARYLVLDEIRKRQRKRLFNVIGFSHEIPSSIDVEQLIENREMVLQQMHNIQTLKPNYRLVISLIKIEECSTKEVAEILNWSEAKVRKTLSRALQALRKMNDKGGEIYGG